MLSAFESLLYFYLVICRYISFSDRSSFRTDRSPFLFGSSLTYLENKFGSIDIFQNRVVKFWQIFTFQFEQDFWFTYIHIYLEGQLSFLISLIPILFQCWESENPSSERWKMKKYIYLGLGETLLTW
jgi:hypothetical protein